MNDVFAQNFADGLSRLIETMPAMGYSQEAILAGLSMTTDWVRSDESLAQRAAEVEDQIKQDHRAAAGHEITAILLKLRQVDGDDSAVMKVMLATLVRYCDQTSDVTAAPALLRDYADIVEQAARSPGSLN